MRRDRAKEILTQADLKDRLDYDPATGEFTYLADGRRAGWVSGNRYRYISVRCVPYLAHRLAFLFTTGCWPLHLVDHRDGDRTNNRWTNLREATPSQNGANCSVRADSGTAVKGVIFVASCGLYRARIRLRGKTAHIGYYRTKQDAAAAYWAAASTVFGEFARAG